MSDNKLLEDAGKHVPYPATMDDAKWCMHCADEWPCVTRRLADALEARQPSENDRECLARLLAAQDGEEWDRLVGAVEHARNRYLRKAGAILDRMPSLSRAAVPDAATEIARNLANATALTGQDARVIAEAAVRVAAAGEIAEDHARCDGRLLSVEKHAERMEAERDAATEGHREALGYVAKTLDNCEDLPDDLKWDNSEVVEMLRDILAALDGAPEPEVIAMRDRLAEEVMEALKDVDDSGIADWLISSGWVTSEPEEDSKDYQYVFGSKKMQK